MRRFFQVNDVHRPSIYRIYEVSGNLLYALSGETRSGLCSINDRNLESVIRNVAKSDFGRSSPLVIEEVEFRVGIFHPSIARPTFQKPDKIWNLDFEAQINEVRQVERQIGILIQEIEECFDVVSPAEGNFDAYGFVFQNIIHLSCIEIEALFVKVLKENKILQKKYTFSDFRRLNRFMRLSDYVVTLPKYPWISEIVPFQNWSQESSRSLQWQRANNNLKHANRDSLKNATMRNALQSVCAFMILFVAVFGDEVLNFDFEGDLSYFHFKRRPSWPLQEWYFEAEHKRWSSNPIVFE